MPRKRSPEHLAFGAAIRELRRQRKLSQEQLGYLSGLHRNYVGGVERGELNPTLTTITKFAAALALRPSELIRAAEELGEVPVDERRRRRSR